MRIQDVEGSRATCARSVGISESIAASPDGNPFCCDAPGLETPKVRLVVMRRVTIDASQHMEPEPLHRPHHELVIHGAVLKPDEPASDCGGTDVILKQLNGPSVLNLLPQSMVTTSLRNGLIWSGYLGRRNFIPRSSFRLIVASMSSVESGTLIALRSFRIQSVGPTMA